MGFTVVYQSWYLRSSLCSLNNSADIFSGSAFVGATAKMIAIADRVALNG
ncbi:hypothetical protein [Nostoc sp.]